MKEFFDTLDKLAMIGLEHNPDFACTIQLDPKSIHKLITYLDETRISFAFMGSRRIGIDTLVYKVNGINITVTNLPYTRSE